HSSGGSGEQLRGGGGTVRSVMTARLSGVRRRMEEGLRRCHNVR
ncbi:hypothetical protein A2U01_0011055, partial [Trifolium medium]|nr:hypothetical protein [Trifolium medium]